MMPLLLCVSLAAPQPPAEKDKNIPPGVERALLATVLVKSDSSEYRQGTGVTIGIQEGYAYVLTASHVLGRDSNLRIEFMSKVSEPRADSDLVANARQVDVAARRPVPDFAILKVQLPRGNNEPPPSVAQLAPFFERPMKFPVKAYAVGFSKPEKIDDPLRATVSTFDLVGKKLKYADQSSSGEVALVWTASEAGDEGRSGGPLLNEKGQVIGICMGKEGTRGIYTHLDEIHAYMRKNGFTNLLGAK